MPTMPNVVGVEYQQALQAMVTAGVRVVPLGYFQADPVTLAWVRSGVKPGVVTAQSPSSGTSMLANAPAVLTVGEFPVSVSNYGGVGT
jgi:beta-lactam-binding protein with PASTA domain